MQVGLVCQAVREALAQQPGDTTLVSELATLVREGNQLELCLERVAKARGRK